jgi:hypothetical protein
MARFIMLSLLLSLSACSTTKNVFEFKKEDIVIGLQKGACFGNCSVYNLNIYKNRYVVFEGLINVDKYGVYSKQLSKQEFSDLKTSYDNAGFMNMKDQYSIDIVDMPLITMSYNSNKVMKTILGRSERPDALIKLQLTLEKLSKSDGWKLEKAYEEQSTNDVTNRNLEVKDDIIENQVIIEPSPNIPLAQWFKKYEDYDVQLIKKVAPNLNYWLITYDINKIEPASFIKLLKDDSEIKHAEFNKVISKREH